MNKKVVSSFFSRFSLKSYVLYTYLACVIILIIGAAVRYIELGTIWDALMLLVWPLYGTWIFLRYFAFEMIAYDTVIPAWIGYVCFLFFIGWGCAVLALKQKRIRTIVVILLILFALLFIGGCTYMTSALSPYGLVG